MVIILDDFFIHVSDFLIDVLLKIIDSLVSFLNRFDEWDVGGNMAYEYDLSDIDDKAITKSLIGNNKSDLGSLSLKSRIRDFLKNDSIFEELENGYYLDSSSKMSNSSRKGDNIFSSVNMENDGGYISEDESNHKRSYLEEIKARGIGFLLNVNFLQDNHLDFMNHVIKSSIFLFFVLCMIIALISYFISLELGLAILLIMFLFTILIFYYPKIRKQNDYSSFSKELPYALRQLATELRSGKSLFDSIASVVESDYGIVSLEFSRVLEEIKYGETTENAFLNLDKRVNSEVLSRVIYEILTSLRVGANLSGALTIIAADVNFNIRMKLKEYSEKLNAFVMIYTFLAILAPVILLTMLLAGSVVIGDLVPGDLVLILYSVFFPMVIVFLGIAIKRLEPKI